MHSYFHCHDYGIATSGTSSIYVDYVGILGRQVPQNSNLGRINSRNLYPNTPEMSPLK